MEENLRACLPASLPFACPALTAPRRVGLADTQIQIQLQSNSRRNKRRNYMHTYLWTCSPSAKLTLTTTMRIANNESFPLLLATQLNCFCMLFRCSSFCLSHSLCFPCLPPYRFCLTLRLFDIFVFLFCVLYFVFLFYFYFASSFCFNSSLFAHNFSETCVRRQTNAWINTHWANDNEWMSEWVSGWVNEWMSEWMAVRGRGRWVNALFEKCKSQIQNTST